MFGKKPRTSVCVSEITSEKNFPDRIFRVAGVCCHSKALHVVEEKFGISLIYGTQCPDRPDFRLEYVWTVTADNKTWDVTYHFESPPPWYAGLVADEIIGVSV